MFNFKQWEVVGICDAQMRPNLSSKTAISQTTQTYPFLLLEATTNWK